ncbi:3-beta hydroxysteroid dehydrogenase [Planotetraspora thailandica]|uniref:3-beta hydroxysteroid dehydrogenase n=1 Tax=Planotetraspora thailandica TaxID=487172 RepID=A0A8J3VAT7_9ACTN|nr:NAD(P)H-binding protein [Planotetraspora thailandica]GII57479.1 3-beta hydroxysteroid dehydrogenase [Planotetraspora thailandica]
MKIAVAGGTGVAGRLVVEALRARGHVPVVVSRGQGVDLLSGSGLDAALAGAEAVIDVSNVITTRKSVSVDFFDKAGRHLVGAAERAGVRHLVTLSIVGVDRVKYPYYTGKLRQEEIVREGAVPWTILRATQFHEFVGQVLSGVPGPIAVVPTGRVQPVAAWEVAELLADLAPGSPQAMAPELAGPRVESLVDMVRRLIAAGGAPRRPVLPLYFPGGMSSGGLLPTGPGPRGTQTFADWLREKVPAMPA